MDVMEKLVELLSKYFNIGDSYAYNLTRVKSAFACGTVGLDDFEEFDDETVEDIASYLIDNGVTVQEWISVEDRLPDDNDRVIAFRPNEPETSAYKYCVMWGWSVKASLKHRGITHRCEMPQPPKGE